MKNTIKLIGLIAIAAVIGFTMAACDNGDDGGNPVGGPDPALNGTWVGGDEGTKLVMNNGSITVSNYNDVPVAANQWIEIMKGTYSTIGNSLTVIFSQVNGAIFGNEGSALGILSTQWYTVVYKRVVEGGRNTGLG